MHIRIRSIRFFVALACVLAFGQPTFAQAVATYNFTVRAGFSVTIGSTVYTGGQAVVLTDNQVQQNYQKLVPSDSAAIAELAAYSGQVVVSNPPASNAGIVPRDFSGSFAQLVAQYPGPYWNTNPRVVTNDPGIASWNGSAWVLVANSAPIAQGTILAAPSVSISGVAITGTAGQISFTASGTVAAGQQITIAGTNTGSGSIANGTYLVAASPAPTGTTATLQTLSGGAIVTTAGTPTGLTYAFAAAPGALPLMFANGVWGRGRTILIGDSLLANAYRGQNAVQNTTGGMVVTGNTATFYVPLTHGLTGPGQIIQVFNPGDAAFSYAINGANVPVVSMPDATHFTISACVAGSCLAPGDYSGINSGVPVSGGNAWQFKTLSQGQDGSWFRWFNMFNSNPWTVVANYAIGGTGYTTELAMLPKIAVGPVFDIALIECGTNDVDNAGSTATLTVAAARASAAGTIQVANAVLAMGARVILGIPPPVAAGFTNAQASNIGFNELRYLLLTYAYKTPNVFTIDLFKNMVDVSGNMNAAYTDSFSAYVHPLPAAFIPLVKNESVRLAPVMQNTDFINVSVLDDSSTYTGTGYQYPNLLSNGYMSGTNNSPGGTWTGWSGSTPTNWSFLNHSGTPTLVGTGAVTRVAGTNQNSNALAWGYEWTANITWTASSQSFVLWNNTADITTLNSLIAAAGPGSGIYVRAGFTVRATNACANLSSIYGILYFGAALPGQNFNDAYDQPHDTYPLASGDVLEIQSEPYWIPYGTTLSSLAEEIGLFGSTGTSGSCNLAFSSAYIRPVQNPYQ